MKMEIITAIFFAGLSIAFIFWVRKEIRKMEKNKYKKDPKKQNERR